MQTKGFHCIRFLCTYITVPCPLLLPIVLPCLLLVSFLLEVLNTSPFCRQISKYERKHGTVFTIYPFLFSTSFPLNLCIALLLLPCYPISIHYLSCLHLHFFYGRRVLKVIVVFLSLPPFTHGH